MSALPTAASPPRVRGGRRDEDTAAGCRAKAADDMARAAAMDAAPLRRRMEHSAAAWTARAEQLEREERAFSARLVRPSVRGHRSRRADPEPSRKSCDSGEHRTWEDSKSKLAAN